MKNGQFKKSFNIFVLALGLILAQPQSFASDYPKPVADCIAEACKFYDQGKYSSARMQFNEALGMEKNCPDAYNGLGLCSMKEGQIEESNGWYLEAIKLKPDYYNALFNLANNYYVARNYSEAISYYLRANKAREKTGQASDADLLVSLASVYSDRAMTRTGLYRQQDMAQALNFYHQAIKQNPDHPQAHAMLGRLYFDAKQLGVAEKELRTAVSLRPNYAYAYYVLGQLYVQKKEYPAALVAFHSSLSFETVDKYKHDTGKAMTDLGIPSSIVDHFAQGFENLNSGNLEGAQTEFEAAASENTPFKSVALNNLGYANARAGNFANAIDCYQRALKLHPHGQPELYYNLGEAFVQTKRLPEAEQAFNQCIAEAKGNHYLAHNALGIVLKTKGDLDGALKQYSLALLQSGGSLSVVEFNRGLVLEKLGRKQDAAESYTKYLQASPSGLNAAAAKEHLGHVK